MMFSNCIKTWEDIFDMLNEFLPKLKQTGSSIDSIVLRSKEDNRSSAALSEVRINPEQVSVLRSSLISRLACNGSGFAEIDIEIKRNNDFDTIVIEILEEDEGMSVEVFTTTMNINLFISNTDMKRMSKGLPLGKNPHDGFSYVGSISSISQYIHPEALMQEPYQLVPCSGKYDSKSMLNERLLGTYREKEYIQELYDECMEVVHHSDADDVNNFNVEYMRRLIAGLPIRPVDALVFTELAHAALLDRNTSNFVNPVEVKDFFTAYCNAVNKKAEEFLKPDYGRIEFLNPHCIKVENKECSASSNSLLGAADLF